MDLLEFLPLVFLFIGYNMRKSTVRISCLLPGFSALCSHSWLQCSVSWAQMLHILSTCSENAFAVSTVRVPNYPWHSEASLILHAPIQHTFLEAHASPGPLLGHWVPTEPWTCSQSRGVTLRTPVMTSQCIRCYHRGSPSCYSSEEGISLGHCENEIWSY